MYADKFSRPASWVKHMLCVKGQLRTGVLLTSSNIDGRVKDISVKEVESVSQSLSSISQKKTHPRPSAW